MMKNNNQQTLSAIVGIVAVVGLVMLISGAQTAEVYDAKQGGGIGFGGPSGAQIVEVYRGGNQQCARILTDAGIVIDCGIDIGILSTGFGVPSKIADQFRSDLIQGSFEVDGGITAFGAESRGGTFGPSKEFTQGTGQSAPYLGVYCWDTFDQGRLCVGFD